MINIQFSVLVTTGKKKGRGKGLERNTKRSSVSVTSYGYD